uniref:Uncharacterized protein n=1 Tax=viral metagenome TaxID=1070528 RepID=A0A6C0B394_9ZZZZ
MNQKIRTKTLDMYDVNSYTEDELINNILDLNNPTDRELEHKIMSLYNRYQIINTKEGQQLAKFFLDIYNRFFDDASDGTDEDASTNEDDNEDDVSQQNNIIIEGMDSKTTIPPTPTTSSSAIDFVKPGEYAQDRLNPTIKETIKRIVSIDSQYRDDKRTMSTNFTFSLSEQLKDVVSLKLYSIQIPQTWYTVPTSYGSNFFYLKGNKSGIDNGYHDYTIDISAGNYTAPNIIAALNTKIQQLKTTYTDVSFGQTNIGYNPNAALATLSVSINNTYNESGYYLYFPTWTSPIATSALTGPRYKSIPGFLGFNYTEYYLNRAYSAASLPLTISSLNSDNLDTVFYLDNTNNYFTIYKYIGPDEYSVNSQVDLSFQIMFTLATGKKYTRTQLINDLSNQLTANTYLNGSSIKRTDITDASLNNNGKSFFQLQITYNRLTTNNVINSKTYVVFPTEIDNVLNSKIWTGNTSCFVFQNNSYEMNNVISESSPISQQSGKYTILNSPYIYLTCVKPDYNVIQNNYQINIPNSTTAGYTLSQYITAINTGIINTNNNTINSKNTLGDFGTFFNAYLDTNSYFNIRIDITRTFTQDMYYVDLAGTFLNSFIDLSGEYLNGQLDLSGSTYKFRGSFPENSYYEVDSNYMLKAYPSTKNYGNQNVPSFVVPTDGEGTIYYTYQEVETAINSKFNNFTDSYGSRIFSGTNIVMTPNELTGYIDCVFTISMKKILNQTDYTISFIDTAARRDGTGNIIFTTSSWSNNLNIGVPFLGTTVTNGQTDTSFNLNLINSGVLPYTTITAINPIVVNKIRFIDGQNNFFYLVPWEEGVATGRPYYLTDNHANDIKFTIPATDASGVIAYTRDNLIIAINEILTSQSVTQGSSIQIINVNNNEYIKLRFNSNKVYTAADYKIVFYDQLSFNKCTPGAQYIQNTTWDITIGWLIGFHNTTEFSLGDYGKPGTLIQIVGDTTVSVNLFDYFLLCVDDFNQNHLNDGMVTVASAVRSFALPSYANKADYVCDPITGLLTYNATAENTVDYNRLTQKQLYSLTSLANSKQESSIITSTPNVNGKSYGSGPYAEDVFGFIPMKTAGLAPGAVYVDYGGTLQNQERTYFGPVNIFRLGIKLISNRGDIIDLNGSDWSFSFLVEQLYQQKPTINSKKK